jgi:hypothetical protein
MFLVQTKPLDTLAEVQAALQSAIELEHATIPPYLTALYSLKEGTNQAIAAIISGIVFQEMQHMAIAANILNAIGGSPLIDDPKFVPHYPGGLPFHIGDRDGNHFEVPLKHFSLPLVRDVFMHIEEPDHPLSIPQRSVMFALTTGQDYQTIGDFYRALRGALKAEWFTGDPARQVGGVVAKVASLADAQSGIDLIVSQGEGTTTSPSDGKQVAHYYRFEEIANQLTLNTDPTVPVGYSFGPPPIPFDPDGVWVTIDNPTSAIYPPGAQARMRSDLFNNSYSDLLEALHATFNGAPGTLSGAIALMNDVKLQAIALMQIPLGNGLNAGPCFEYVP